MADPKIGQTATLNKKKVVWSGQNYGWQSPATHQKLAEQGKFRVGTQALDRLASSANRALEKHAPGVKKHFENVAADQQRQAAAQDRAIRNTAGNRVADLARNDATGKVLDQASKVTNVDRRIVGAAATAAQAAVSRAALKGGVKPPTNATQASARSVGAAARQDVAGRTAPATRSLPTSARPNSTVRPNTASTTSAAKPSLTSAERQRLSKGLQGAGTRQGNNVGNAQANVQNGPGRGPNGSRVFTPTNRAKAVQRANARQARSKGNEFGNRPISSGGMETTSRLTDRAQGNNVKRYNTNNEINFKPKYGGYESASERGGSVKRSKLYNETRTANVEDQVAHQISRSKTGDHVKTYPINDVNKQTGEIKATSSRARYYSSKSNKALASTKVDHPNDPSFPQKLHQINARRGPNNRWTNPANSKDVGKGRKVQRDIQWDPNDLHKPLADLAKDSPRTLVGRRAGGNSNVKARVTPPQPAPKSVGAAKSATKKVTKRFTSPAQPVDRSNGNLASSGRPKYKTKNAITGRTATRLKDRLDSAKGRPLNSRQQAARERSNTTAVEYGRTTRMRDGRSRGGTELAYNPTRTRGAGRDSTRPAPRSRTTRMTREEQRQTLRSGLRDRGSQHVRETLRGQNVSGQARGNRYSINRGGGRMETYGSTNARRSEATRAATTTRRTGGVRNNSQDAGRQAVDRFSGRARTIVNDRIRREGANMTSRERQALTRQLQRQMRQGSDRVRAAAEGQTTRSQNETRSNTRNFTGTGRQAYQEINRMDRRGRSESQYRARASRVRVSRTTPNRGHEAVNPRAASNSSRVSPAVNMRRRRSAR